MDTAGPRPHGVAALCYSARRLRGWGRQASEFLPAAGSRRCGSPLLPQVTRVVVWVEISPHGS